jgi:transcriptional regulator of met regulon
MMQGNEVNMLNKISLIVPIALFTFKRPERTRRTLESLALNAEFLDSPLFIYCDGECA